MNPLHFPIYPTGEDNVVYSIKNIQKYGKLEFFETIYFIYKDGAKEIEYDKTLKFCIEEAICGNEYSYERGGIGESRFIEYEWKLISNDEEFSRKISFCTYPYSVLEHPIPVYITGNINNVFNCVFIPDYDIFLNLQQDFLHNVFNFINAIHLNKVLKKYFNAFNFFVHLYPAKAARDRSDPHGEPEHKDKISFCIAKAIIHKQNYRDFSGSSYFSIDIGSNNAFIHELSHTLYVLSDEYGERNGRHYSDKPYTNNWEDINDANSEAISYFGDTSKVKKIDSYYKICHDNCVMNNGTDFDLPCSDKIFFISRHKFEGYYQTTKYGIKFDDEDIRILCERLNTDANNFYNTKYISDILNQHLAFNLVIENNIISIKKNSYSLRPGRTPYLKAYNTDSSIDCYDENDHLISSNFINLISNINSNFEKNLENELYIQYNKNIKKITIPDFSKFIDTKANLMLTNHRINGKVVIPLDSKEYQDLFQ